MLTEIPGGHPHRSPPARAVSDLMAPSRGWGLPAAGVDQQPVWWALAALRGQCASCARVVARWLADVGDPWLLTRLLGPAASDVRLVARRLRRGPEGVSPEPSVVRALMRHAFGPDATEVVVALVSHDDPAEATGVVLALSPPRRVRLAHEILADIGHRSTGGLPGPGRNGGPAIP